MAVTDPQATLAGTVNPQGQLTSYAFQFGTTTAYGQQTSLTSAGSGTADTPVRADLAGLTAADQHGVDGTLNDLGQRLLRERGTMRVKATVMNALVRGQTVTKTMTLIRYSTHGLAG